RRHPSERARVSAHGRARRRSLQEVDRQGEPRPGTMSGVMRRKDGAPHPAFGHPLLLALLSLLFASAASAANLRELKDPAKIKDAFPAAAKLRVVNIWATWCVPCVAEMPELRAVAAAFGPEVALVGVSADDMVPESSRDKVAAFLEKQKIG